MERVAIADSSSGEFLQKKSRRRRAVENRLLHNANTTESCRADDGPPCRFFLPESTTVIRAGSTLVPLGVVRRRAGTSREPPSSSTSAVDKVTARHYWGAADQGDVEAGEGEEADEGVGAWLSGWLATRREVESMTSLGGRGREGTMTADLR